jgi:glycosyltransferase involved in cell wall biosynthesis
MSGMPILVQHRVVFVIPAFNEARFIGQALASLQAQTCADFRVLICDNASEDDTGRISREICQSDRRFVYVRHASNIGGFKNTLFGLLSSASDYFSFLGAHDRLAPSFLEQTLGALDHAPEKSLCYTHTVLIDEEDKISKITNGGDYVLPADLAPAVRYLELAYRLGSCEAINQLVRRSCLDVSRLRPCWGTDLVMLCHLVAHGPFHRIEEPLYHRRVFPGRGQSYMERLTGRAATPDYGQTALAFLQDVWSHPAITEEYRPALIQALLQVLQKRFGCLTSNPDISDGMPAPVEISCRTDLPGTRRRPQR